MASGIEAVGSWREGSDKELKKNSTETGTFRDRSWLILWKEPQKYCKDLKCENSYNMYKT